MGLQPGLGNQFEFSDLFISLKDDINNNLKIYAENLSEIQKQTAQTNIKNQELMTFNNRLFEATVVDEILEKIQQQNLKKIREENFFHEVLFQEIKKYQSELANKNLENFLLDQAELERYQKFINDEFDKRIKELEKIISTLDEKIKTLQNEITVLNQKIDADKKLAGDKLNEIFEKIKLEDENISRKFQVGNESFGVPHKEFMENLQSHLNEQRRQGLHPKDEVAEIQKFSQFYLQKFKHLIKDATEFEKNLVSMSRQLTTDAINYFKKHSVLYNQYLRLRNDVTNNEFKVASLKTILGTIEKKRVSAEELHENLERQKQEALNLDAPPHEKMNETVASLATIDSLISSVNREIQNIDQLNEEINNVVEQEEELFSLDDLLGQADEENLELQQEEQPEAQEQPEQEEPAPEKPQQDSYAQILGALNQNPVAAQNNPAANPNQAIPNVAYDPDAPAAKAEEAKRRSEAKQEPSPEPEAKDEHRVRPGR